MTIRRESTASATIGATYPPNDWATTTTSRRSGSASTTVEAYSASPAASSSTGRSGATVTCPRSRRSASTRCQYHPTSPAPWMNANVAIASARVRSLGADEIPRLDLAFALDRDRPARLEIELVCEQVTRGSCDLDATRWAVRLHPAGGVHGVAPEAVEEAFPPDHTRHDRARVD